MINCEGDVYPRPRYTCPASYLKFHKESKLFFEKIPTLFPNGANAGVRIITHPHTMRHADLDLSSLSQISPRSLDGSMLGSCGIPMIYRGKGVCNSVFGENARLFARSLLNEGIVLDAVSAVILAKRGVDTGHANCEGTQYDDILALGKELCAIHYNDNHGLKDEHLIPYLGTLNHDEIMHALIDVSFEGYFTLECSSSLIKKNYWLGGRREFGCDTRLAEPPLFMQQRLEALLYDTAEYLLSSYGMFEK